MTDTTASKNTVANGSFNTQQSHDIKSGLLEAAIVDYEAIATTFAANAISDDKVRQQYSKHIREISDQVRQEVAKGNITVRTVPNIAANYGTSFSSSIESTRPQ